MESLRGGIVERIVEECRREISKDIGIVVPRSGLFKSRRTLRQRSRCFSFSIFFRCLARVELVCFRAASNERILRLYKSLVVALERRPFFLYIYIYIERNNHESEF